MRSYKPEELFDEKGRLQNRSCGRLAPTGGEAHGQPTRTPNGGCYCADLLALPDFRSTTRWTVDKQLRHGSRIRGDESSGDVPTRRAMKMESRRPRTSASSAPTRLAIEPTGSDGPTKSTGKHLRSPRNRPGGWRRQRTVARRPGDGNALSEHTAARGWLEGYLLTGRHGFFSCYEAFIHIDRFDGEPARQVAEKVQPGSALAQADRRSAQLLLSSRRRSGVRTTTASATRTPASSTIVAEQEGGHVTRIYLPPDANCLLSCRPTTACGAGNYINVVVADKQPAPV